MSEKLRNKIREKTDMEIGKEKERERIFLKRETKKRDKT